MRSIQCHWYYYDVNTAFRKSQSTSCWGYTMYNLEKGSSVHKNKSNIIYIDQWKEPETAKYAPLLVSIINEITPCKFLTIKGIKYIKFKMLKTYDQSLILLNFIRNLWCLQPMDGMMGTYQYLDFFKELEKRQYKDPLKLLTHANKVACRNAKYAIGHSNIGVGSEFVLRETSDLIKWNGNQTQLFLKGKT